MDRRSTLKNILLGACVPSSLAIPAWAQGYPDGPVRIIVPLSTGGGVDVLARILADKLTRRFGKSFVVENKPGGGGTIGTEFVARAPANGQVLLFTGNSHTLNPYLFKLRFDARKDFVPIAQVVKTYQILVAHPSTGFTSVADVIRAARARPGEITYGSGGQGTPSHIAGVVLEKMAGIRLAHIPYKGSGGATSDILGGQIQLLFSSLPSSLPHVASGKLVALGISSAAVTPMAPQVPTIAQTVPGYQQTTWFGLLGPRGTSPAIRDALAREIKAVLETPEMRLELANNGMEPADLGPAAFGRALDAELAAWGEFVKDTPIKID